MAWYSLFMPKMLLTLTNKPPSEWQNQTKLESLERLFDADGYQMEVRVSGVILWSVIVVYFEPLLGNESNTDVQFV